MQVACQPDVLPRRSRLVGFSFAPAWHTQALLALLLAVPFTSLLWPSVGGAAPEPSALSRYLPSVLVSAALAAYVSRLGLPRSILRELVGRTWSSARRGLADLTVAAGLALLVLVLDAVLTRALAAPESLAAHALLPRTLAERASWSLLAVSAGVGEELVYRGYLQRQLAGFTRSRALGLALQAMLFGIAHGEYGGAVVGRYALYGALFGIVVVLRGSLLPVILAHVALDLYGGSGG